jgi:hypothetical protein
MWYIWCSVSVKALFQVLPVDVYVQKKCNIMSAYEEM